MRHSLAASARTLCLLAFGITAIAGAPGVQAEENTVIAEGRQLAFDRSKGNCLACHMIDGGDMPGNIGPPLIAMQARFPDKEKLRAQIWDATQANPNSIMPPFGRNAILTPEEFDKVLEFVYSL